MSSAAPRLTILVSTYERHDALDAVLRGLSQQSDTEFEVVVTDDGSGPDTRAVVENWQTAFGEALVHIWQPDEGYRLALVRNRGALAAHGDYLVFMDGDCVPRRGFVRALRESAQPGWFVAGRRLELGPDLSTKVRSGAVSASRWSLARWMLQPGFDRGGLWALTPRDRRRTGNDRLPEFEPHANAYGFLFGVSRSDFERANGFDARYVGWGEEDVDLALRLRRLGLKCGHAGPEATLLHLWHPPSKPAGRRNAPLLAETESGNSVEAVSGLRELRAGLAGQLTA
jgi:GT2 family glycosyltransferase